MYTWHCVAALIVFVQVSHCLIQTSISRDDIISSIIEQRKTKPQRCSRPRNIYGFSAKRHSSIAITDEEDDNWSPYLKRCHIHNINTHESQKPSQYRIPETFMTDKFVYVHVFKAGGTTVMGGMNRLLDSNSFSTSFNFFADPNMTPVNRFNATFSQLPVTRFNQFVASQSTSSEQFPFVFTFVRDPINKFLSAFFEINRRILLNRFDSELEKVHDLEAIFMQASMHSNDALKVLDFWIGEMFARAHDETFMSQPRYSKYSYINAHAFPNMLFLNDQIDFDFVGRLDRLGYNLPRILRPYVSDTAWQQEDQFMGDWFPNIRSRKSVGYIFQNDENNSTQIGDLIKQYDVGMEELNDEQIRRLCDVFWMDYLCLPFDLPPQCDLKQLIKKHYGRHVTYRHCYD